MARSDSPKLAVLIDADNTTPTIIEALLVEIAKYGTATVRRAYGDWTTPRLSGWKDANNSHAIQPMQQFSYTTGKNATDSALIIDAMDLLYTGNLDGFCLVSSDSDFTKLASRLRESGMTVYGFGEPKTPKPLVAACDKFVYLDVLRSDNDTSSTNDDATEAGKGRASTPSGSRPAPKRRSSQDLRGDRRLVRSLRDAIDANSDDDGWAHLGGVGSHVAKQAPDFDSRNWGYAKLVDLISEIGLFEVERTPGQQVRVREIPKQSTNVATPENAEKTEKRPAKKVTARRAPKKATKAPEQTKATKAQPTQAESKKAEPTPVEDEAPPVAKPQAARKKVVTRRAVKSMEAMEAPPAQGDAT